MGQATAVAYVIPVEVNFCNFG